MEIKQSATAGSVESNDALVMVTKGEGLIIELESPVKKQFGRQIRSIVENTIKKLGVENIHIKVQDKGALDCTIQARTETAIRRACKNEDYNWEVD